MIKNLGMNALSVNYKLDYKILDVSKNYLK